MFELAGQVHIWQNDGRTVWLARLVTASGMGSVDPAASVALTEDLPPAGTVLFGAADAALAAALAEATADEGGPRLLDLNIADDRAREVGLSCGGRATVLLQPATDLPEPVWALLAARTPVCLVTDLDGAHLGRTSWLSLASDAPSRADADPVTQAREVIAVFGRGTSEAAVVDVEGRRLLVTPFWPTSRLVIVGDGLIADALDSAARLMGWEPVTVNATAEAAGVLAGLGAGDGVIVLSHDRTVDAPVIATALASPAGYVAALGSRRTQAARAEWLTEHGVAAADTGRVRGPAGLDIGARTPAEIAISIVAEMIAVRAGATGTPLVGNAGPIHHDGLQAPPARHRA